MDRTLVPPTLQDALTHGQFVRALQSLNEVSDQPIFVGSLQDKPFRKWCQDIGTHFTQQPDSWRWSSEGMQVAADMVELLYYLYKPEEAEPFLNPYKDVNNDRWKTNAPGLSSALRIGLLVAQSLYEQRKFEEAGRLSEKICKWCDDHKKKNYLGLGLAYHQMARVWGRRDEFGKAEHYCDQAILALAEAGDGIREQDLQIVWRMGRVWLSEGHLAWTVGDLFEADRKVRIARFFLRHTEDFLHKAHVAHSLGCICQAQGKYRKAHRFFHEAETAYMLVKPILPLTRLYVHWGQNAYEAGCVGTYDDSDDSDDGCDQKTTFENAEKHFIHARNLAKEIKNKRQEGLSFIALSLLYGEENFARRNLDEAKNALEAGKNLVFDLPHNRRSCFRAYVALGIYHMRTHDYTEAKKQLDNARKLAENLEVRPFQAYAHLLLCDLYCTMPPNDIEKAQRYYDSALLALRKETEDNLPPSAFLKMHFERMKQKIFVAQIDQIVVPGEDIKSGKGIKTIEKEVRQKIFTIALLAKGGNRSKAAALLGLSRPAFDKASKQLGDVSQPRS